MTETRTLEAPGAVLHYDVRPGGGGAEPPLLLIGSPMGAPGFTTLAGHFPDRAIVTYDPRGAERSARTDGAAETAVEEHVDDLRRLIETVGGLVDLFGSSGGAVNGLALAARHPELVRLFVAHEPPVSRELPDHEVLLGVCQDIRRTYLDSGLGPAMAKFLALISYEGPLTEEAAERLAPDPAAFGLPTEDDGARDDPLLGQNMLTCTFHRHDFAALRAASTRIAIGVGAESGEQLPARAARAVAGRLGVEPVVFPGGHGGFLGGEYGQTGEPAAFAAALRATFDALG